MKFTWIYCVVHFAFLSVVTFDVTFSWTVDPDEDRNIAEIIESRGYQSESHYIQTEDSYILGVFRIVNPLIEKVGLELKRPIVLQHGLLSSGADFIMTSPGGGIHEYFLDHADNFTDNEVNMIGNNLGFVLANLGYDVWIANSRGNTYSRNHTHLDPDKDRKFWEFTFDEMIAYDAPAIIDYIMQTTKQGEVGWVGHSQGTLIMFGLLSTRPEYTDIVKPFIALAPVARVDHIGSPIRILAKLNAALEFLRYEGGELLPSNFFIKFLESHLCAPPLRFICTNMLFLLMGYDSKQLNMTRLPVYMAHEPAGTSCWNLVHFGQLVNSRTFAKFDYGKKDNIKKYGAPSPPIYPLDRINSSNIALMYSKNDLLADPEDVFILKSLLKVPLLKDYLVPFKKWNHMDFTFAKQTGYYINTVIVDILRKIDGW